MFFFSAVQAIKNYFFYDTIFNQFYFDGLNVVAAVFAVVFFIAELNIGYLLFKAESKKKWIIAFVLLIVTAGPITDSISNLDKSITASSRSALSFASLDQKNIYLKEELQGVAERKQLTEKRSDWDDKRKGINLYNLALVESKLKKELMALESERTSFLSESPVSMFNEWAKCIMTILALVCIQILQFYASCAISNQKSIHIKSVVADVEIKEDEARTIKVFKTNSRRKLKSKKDKKSLALKEEETKLAETGKLLFLKSSLTSCLNIFSFDSNKVAA